MEFFFKQTYTCIPKSENDARMQAKLEKKNLTGLPVGVVSEADSQHKTRTIEHFVG